MSGGRTRSAAVRFTRCALAALLFVGVPANGLVEGANPAAPAALSGILSVESDPPGAAVFVDGEALGTTPIAVRTLPAGDHRVRVAKQGYLDNSRVVRLQGGQAESVKVKLTRNEMVAAPQVDTQPAKKSTEKKGSGKKWAFIGLGAAAVGAAVYVVATKNDPPVAGTIGVSPTATGMAGITSYTFTSQGSSDPDKDPLTYDWAFGDGGTGSGSSTSHVYAGAGTNTVSLTVSDNHKHSVTAPSATVTVARSMASTWTGGVDPGFTGTSISYNLTQSGTSLGGSITKAGNLSGTVPGVTGTVNGTTHPATATFSTPAYGIGVAGVTVTDRFTGTTDSAGNTMTGTCTVQLTGAFFTATGSCTFRR